MTKEELAAMLDGRQYREETTPQIEKLAKENNLLIIFGASDDLCEFRGAICDEFGCYDGGTIKCWDLPKTIEAIWCPDNKNCSWAYETELPYAEFRIYEDDEIYCVGIVVDIAERSSIIKCCDMCYNAKVNGCADEDDLSYAFVGNADKGYNIVIGSGGGKPVRIEFDVYDKDSKRMAAVGTYFPKFCPNCGRPLTEYEVE